MIKTRNQHFQKVVKFCQELMSDSTVTPELISLTIDKVLHLTPQWGDGLNRQEVTDELIRRNSLWIGDYTSLVNEKHHVRWLNASRKADWRYWGRHREWLERSFSLRTVEATDESTDLILGLLEDPVSEGPWDRRGLVVGHVQSGKTGNYSALICKAADAGYKIIIVLAGLHNNLRSQTQARLDEAFLGYETRPSDENPTPIGVGEIDSDPKIRPNYVTNRSEHGDFSTKVLKHLGVMPEHLPWLFVVKKNKTVLDRLLKWIRINVANTVDKKTKHNVVPHLPLLIIDDEADHASVDTGAQIFDSEGHPDEEHEPRAINRLIRQILCSFVKSAYVGYTATPFANIFIHDQGKTKQEGYDLFPSSFIISLAAPSNYVGPSKLFGIQTNDTRTEGLPLVRTVSDYSTPAGMFGWMPEQHKSSHSPVYGGQRTIPPSLAEAIDSFILSTATRTYHGGLSHHSSMLIHVTRFNSVQQQVADQVKEHIRQLCQHLRRKIGHETILARLKQLWVDDFIPTHHIMCQKEPDLCGNDLPTWEDLNPCIYQVVEDIEIMTINGTAKDALEYTGQHQTGMKVIAIGGDKLSRGLTLEGLITSYFLRASRMYDTLMQMGRWFGYRTNYLDLCRLYTTQDLLEWFEHITDASEELRQEFDFMATIGGTPKDYGLKVQSHPVLMVTSPLKMRSAKKLFLSYSGTSVETVALFRDYEKLKTNLMAVRALLSGLGNPDEIDPIRKRGASEQKFSAYVWHRIKHDVIIDFLNSYKTHPAAHKVNALLLLDFISSMAAIGQLSEWTIDLVGGGEGTDFEILDGFNLSTLKRKPENILADRYSIGRLISPKDEAIDLDEAAWLEALEYSKKSWRKDPGRLQTQEPSMPYGPAIRHVRGFGGLGVQPHPERGLLLLYILDPLVAGTHSADCPPAGFGISFPASSSGKKIEYMANVKLWEQEYGGAD